MKLFYCKGRSQLFFSQQDFPRSHQRLFTISSLYMLPVRGFQLQPSSLKSVLLFYFFQQYWLFYKIPPSLFFFCLFLFSVQYTVSELLSLVFNPNLVALIVKHSAVQARHVCFCFDSEKSIIFNLLLSDFKNYLQV